MTALQTEMESKAETADSEVRRYAYAAVAPPPPMGGNDKVRYGSAPVAVLTATEHNPFFSRPRNLRTREAQRPTWTMSYDEQAKSLRSRARMRTRERHQPVMAAVGGPGFDWIGE